MAARAHAGTRATRASRSRTNPRRRPAQRRRLASRRRPAPRRRRSRVNWDRLGRVALTIVLGAVLVSYLNPLLSFVHTYRGSSVAKERLHELVVENRLLHDRVQSTDDPGVLELEARRQGMIEPGERPYVVHGLNR